MPGSAEPVAVPTWASTIGDLTERSVFGVRYLIPLAALVLGLIGVVYVADDTASRTTSPTSTWDCSPTICRSTPTSTKISIHG